jgi:SAM-dependent methyltransferase
MSTSLTDERPPIPPADLILRVACLFDVDGIDAARRAFDVDAVPHLALFERALGISGHSFADFERMLDFGCGCGRFLRHLGPVANSVEVHGTDIDAEMIGWVRANIPYVRAEVAPHKPPLPYPAGYFDLVINHSVFTHLDEIYQDLWLAELHRITRPEALLLLTVEGTSSWNRLADAVESDGGDLSRWRRELESRGILFIRDDVFIGSTHPDFYHSTFHAPWYVFEHWARFFDVVLYLPDGSISQDLIVLRRRHESAPQLQSGNILPRARRLPEGRGANVTISPVLRERARALKRNVARLVASRGFTKQRVSRRAVAAIRRTEPGRRLVRDSRSTGGSESEWFWGHYEWAVGQIVDFCEPVGIELRGREIADIGSGDGIMAVGLCRRVAPARVAGFDVHLTNREILAARCRAEGVGELPPQLEFYESTETSVPAADGSFDFVYSWSAFEHISQPVEVLKEIRRILRAGGHFFLQLWPFYLSAKGSHLWEWIPEDHHHLTEESDGIIAKLRASDRHSAEWTEIMIREFEHLNRMTLDELRQALKFAGFNVLLFELITAKTWMRPGLSEYAWGDLATGGIKLLASPAYCSKNDDY